MRELTIVFTKSKKKVAFLSKAIMLWTNKPYSHVARKFKIRLSDKASYYQASEGKVNYEIEDIFDTKHEIVKEYTLSVPDEIYREIGKSCWEDAGKKYGTMQNVGIFITDIAAFLGIKMDNPFKGGRNCSELIYVDAIQKLCDCTEYAPDKIKPHEVEDIINKHLKHLIVDFKDNT